MEEIKEEISTTKDSTDQVPTTAVPTAEKRNSKPELSKIALVVSVIAILYCLLCTVFFFPHKEDLGFDYQGIIVAILAVTVTIFVAVQIYQSVTLLKDVEAKNKELREENTKNNKELSDEVKIKIKELDKKIEESNEQNEKMDKKIDSADSFFKGLIYLVQAITFDIERKRLIDAYYDLLHAIYFFTRSESSNNAKVQIQICIKNMITYIGIAEGQSSKELGKNTHIKNIDDNLQKILELSSDNITEKQKSTLIELATKVKKIIIEKINTNKGSIPTKE